MIVLTEREERWLHEILALEERIADQTRYEKKLKRAIRLANQRAQQCQKNKGEKA